MNIAIIGGGSVGSTLGQRWARVGHAIVYGVRDPASDRARTLIQSTPGARVVPNAAATERADCVALCTPWPQTRPAIDACGPLTGKIVIDATNPLNPDFSLAVGLNTSGGEEVARWAAGARVVKAFNTIGANIMADPTLAGGRRATLFMAGDDPDAKAAVQALARDIGFDPLDVGPLISARHLEPLAALWIDLAFKQGLGREFAFTLIRR